MSTRKRYVLAGLAAIALISVSLVMLDRSGNRKYDDLKNRMAAENAAQDAARAQELAELQRQRSEEITALERNQLANLTLLAQMTAEALNNVYQAAEAELRKATEAWEQRLDALKAEIVAQRAKTEALMAAQQNATPAAPDLATIWKETNGVVKIYEYSSFELDKITGISLDKDGKIQLDVKKFKFDGRLGHLSGFVDDDQYVWSAGHLKDRDNSRPITELWCVFRDDLNLPPEKLELVGYDWLKDLALLRFRRGFKFPGKTFRLGDADSVRPGDKVIAMGCPLDAQFTITEGEVMDKEYVGMELGFTQPRLFIHSAPITFGNSGGPLILKRTGEVIGVNVMLVNAPGGYFLSTMVDDMRDVYPRLKAARGTEVKHSMLEHAAFANSWRINPPDWRLIGVTPITERCVVVTEVQKGSVAAKSGLQVGDIVLEWNGVAPKDDADLWRMITNVVPSAVGTMKVKRGDETKDIRIALGIFKGDVFVHEWYKLEEVTPPPKQ